MASALAQVIEISEAAKAIRRYAFEVSLSALGAIVRSNHAGGELRGFNEVASQMRHWSRDLEGAIEQLRTLAAQRVRLASECSRRERQLGLLRLACESSSHAAALLERCVYEETERVRALKLALRREYDGIEEALDAIGQLGLMASVLSRGALIEASSGSHQQRHDLTIASQDFATYAERVNAAITQLRRDHRSQTR